MRATCCVNSLHLLTARATDIKPENVLVAIDDVEAVIEAESAPPPESASSSSDTPRSKLVGVPPSKGRGGNQTPRVQSAYITGSQPLASPGSSSSLNSMWDRNELGWDDEGGGAKSAGSRAAEGGGRPTREGHFAASHASRSSPSRRVYTPRAPTRRRANSAAPQMRVPQSPPPHPPPSHDLVYERDGLSLSQSASRCRAPHERPPTTSPSCRRDVCHIPLPSPSDFATASPHRRKIPASSQMTRRRLTLHTTRTRTAGLARCVAKVGGKGEGGRTSPPSPQSHSPHPAPLARGTKEIRRGKRSRRRIALASLRRTR